MSYIVGHPSVRYGRSLSVHANDFAHLLDRWIGRYQIVKGQLIIIVYTSDVAAPGDFPKYETKSVNVGSLERIEVVHVERFFQNLKIIL